MEPSREELLKRIQALESQNETLQSKVEDLTNKLDLMIIEKFGKKSEKVSPLQPELFEELNDQDLEDNVHTSGEELEVPTHKRKKAGRKPISDRIPRKEIVHDIPEEDKKCACGCQMSKIDEVVTERLQVIPEKVYVEKHIRPKYACRNCEGSGDEDKPVFRIAPAEPSLLPGSIMTGGLLAYILVNKFCDYLPFYRQEERFNRFGAPIRRQNMSSWTIKTYQKLTQLYDLMKERIKSGTYLQMDETVIQVHGEEGKPDSSNSYIWVSRGGPAESEVILYEYDRSRSSKYILNFVEGFKGYLQTDGYKGYDTALKNNTDITHVGCLAHARRKIHDAYKLDKKNKQANAVLNKFQKIYNTENKLRKQGLTAEEFLIKRKEVILPLLDDLKKWFDKKAESLRPTSNLGKAISYTLGQWDKIINYIYSPYLTPDNNAAERIVKPFVMGRKNWLFAGSTTGVDAMCFYYSLIETAKACGLNPYAYLKWIFEKAPLLEDLSELTPWNCNPEEVNKITLPA